MLSFDLQELKNAATGQWQGIMSRVAGVPLELLSGKHGPCPKHGGKDKFRVFDDFDEVGGAVCNDCGKMADGFAFLQAVLGCSFPKAMELVANHLGVQPKASRGGSTEPTDPAKHLKLLGQNEQMASVWCGMFKKGITPEALWAFGAEYAMYRRQYPVFALPIRGQQNETVGYVLYHALGKTLPIFAKGSPEPAEMAKVKVTSGSKAGWIGPIPKPTDKLVWKTEGPSCALATYSLGLPEGHSVCCNAFGAEENPATSSWMLERFKGIEEAFVVHDSDRSGQRGATEVINENGTSRPGWAPAIANFAKQVRNYVLPWPMVDSHGQDLRDLINQRKSEGLTGGEVREHILAAARMAPIVTAIPIKGLIVTSSGEVTATTEDEPASETEHVDDPHRLARINLKDYQEQHKRTLKYWKQTWYRWKDGVYEELTHDDFAAKITQAIDKEFERVRVKEFANYKKWKASPDYTKEKDRGEPKKRKYNIPMVNNVIQATKGMKECQLRSSQQINSWVDGRNDGFCVAVENGILNITKAISPNPPDRSEILMPHTPDWFSTSKLTFPFDENASCPNWNEFLDDVFNGDTESIQTLQMWFGYLLTPDNSLNKILFVIGKKRSGKGTITSIMHELFGKQNVITPTLGSLSGEFALQPMVGKTVGIVTDARLSERADEVSITEKLLSISGGDPQNISRKYKDTLSSHDLKVRFTIFSNLLPKFKDPSAAFVSRCIFLRMPNCYLGNEDFGLQDRLKSELSGILNWAIVGRHMLNQAGRIEQPKMAKSIVSEMLSIVSPVLEFIESECVLQTQSVCDTKELYRHWEKWCDENDVAAAGTVQSFSRKIKAILPEILTEKYRATPSEFGRRFIGIQPKPDLF
jgi:putative DNA primase/helicase